jgi:hypothetical protein
MAASWSRDCAPCDISIAAAVPSRGEAHRGRDRILRLVPRLSCGNPDGATGEQLLEPCELDLPLAERDRALQELKGILRHDLRTALAAARMPVVRPDFASIPDQRSEQRAAPRAR